jgi:hypothetical protein
MLIPMYFFIQILFVVLRITNVIDWSWNKVLIPTWIMLGILAMWLVFCLGILIVSAAMCF